LQFSPNRFIFRHINIAKEIFMFKHIAIAAAAAFALSSMTATACPLKDAQKAEADKKAEASKKAGTSQPAEPKKTAI
jgi:hypothetical protein